MAIKVGLKKRGSCYLLTTLLAEPNDSSSSSEIKKSNYQLVHHPKRVRKKCHTRPSLVMIINYSDLLKYLETNGLIKSQMESWFG